VSDDRGDLRAAWEARRGTFADDAQLSATRLRRLLWVSAGLASVALGLVGAFLPVLPTTPFMILSAGCFARSSPRLHNWLLSHRLFGPTIYEWRQRRTIPRRVKAVAITLIVVTFSFSIGWVIPALVGQLVMAGVGVAVVVWLLRVPNSL
jgi:hypothetical protein